MTIFFGILSWIAMITLIAGAIPQIVLNYKRKSTEGVSWMMFGLLLFGMATLAVRSWFVTTDVVILLNYNLGAFISLIANIQIFYYRIIRSKKLDTKPWACKDTISPSKCGPF